MDIKNKRIIKHTLILFIRLLFTLCISLYVSRIVLNTLGINDYGIYSIVASILAMLSFINSALSTTTQRFLSYEMDKPNNQLSNIFSMCIYIHILLTIVVAILSDLIGVWFINTYLNIPAIRLEVAITVFQISIITMFINTISIPYTAAIVSYEKMGVFAYLSLGDAILKLIGAIYLSINVDYDSLILYSITLLIITISIKILTICYCYFFLKGTQLKWFWDTKLFKKLLFFSGWSLWGGAAFVIMNHGVNILLNLFFGPIVNAAKGISSQLQGAILQFSTSIQMSITPQIIKNYATENIAQMKLIVLFGAKYSYFLMLFIIMPVLIEVEPILHFWLGEYPKHTPLFVRLMLIGVLVDSLSSTLMAAIQATGKIALYQTIVGSVLILNLPISYAFLYLGFSPETTVIVYIVLSFATLFIRLLFLMKLISLNISEYLHKVLVKVVLVTAISCILPLYVHNIIPDVLNRFLLVLLLSSVGILLTILFLGLEKVERIYINNSISKILNTFKDK